MASVSQVRSGAVHQITLQRAEKRNALNHDLTTAAIDALRGAFADPEVAVVVLDGAGGTLSAGADLGDPGDVERSMRNYPAEPQAQLMRIVRTSPIPVVAVVDGYALGAGLGLAGAATFVVATPRSTFGLPEAGMGFFPFGVVPHLTARVAAHIVLEWALSARRFGAEEAKAAGLVTHLVGEDALPAEVDRLTAALSTAPSRVVRAGMEWLRQVHDQASPADVLDFCEHAIGRQPAPER